MARDLGYNYIASCLNRKRVLIITTLIIALIIITTNIMSFFLFVVKHAFSQDAQLFTVVHRIYNAQYTSATGALNQV